MSVAESAGKVVEERVGAGDDPITEIFTRFQDELLGTLYFQLGNAADARDALQEAFIKCWRRRSEIAGIDNVKAWVFKVAINAGRDLRSCAWQRKREALPDDGESLASRHDSPEANAAKAERVERLRAALRQLRDEEREVFLLRQNGDFTYEQAALSLGLPVGTVKTRMRLALQKLREALIHDDE